MNRSSSVVVLPPRRAGCGIPLGAVPFPLEMESDEARLAEINWILDLGGDREPLVTVGALEQVPILGEHGVRAVRNAVLAQVTWTQSSRHDFERPARRSRRRP